MPQENKSLYTIPFILLCISNVLFSGSFNMIMPELPAFLDAMGGQDYKGLIIALFTLSAGMSRPISGKLADTIGRVPVMVIGTIVCVICSLMYPLLTSVSGFLLLRFFHGFSTGFKPTATVAYGADIVPVHRRGEAMGMMGVSANLGASMFPPLGSYLTNSYSIDYMFYVSSFIALVSIAILFSLRETLPEKQKFHPRLLKLSWEEIIEKNALPIAFVTVFTYWSFGMLFTIAPDQADYLGFENKGMLFTSFTVFAVLSRLIAGKVSDKYGRIPVIKVSIIMISLSLVYLGMADSQVDLLLGSGALGFSTGVASPAVFAWVIDISPEDRRGRYMGTVYIALEVGIGFGALVSAYLYDNNVEQFDISYFISAGLVLLAFIYLQFFYRKPKAHVQ